MGEISMCASPNQVDGDQRALSLPYLSYANYLCNLHEGSMVLPLQTSASLYLIRTSQTLPRLKACPVSIIILCQMLHSTHNALHPSKKKIKSFPIVVGMNGSIYHIPREISEPKERYSTVCLNLYTYLILGSSQALIDLLHWTY